MLAELLILDLMSWLRCGLDSQFRPKVCNVCAPTAMPDGSPSYAKTMEDPLSYPSDMAPNSIQGCWCSSTNGNSP